MANKTLAEHNAEMLAATKDPESEYKYWYEVEVACDKCGTNIKQCPIGFRELGSRLLTMDTWCPNCKTKDKIFSESSRW